jgi:hypothetical protein
MAYQGTYRGSLDDGDYALAVTLAGILARNTGGAADAIPDEWEEIQDSTGWSFDWGRAGGRGHWQRYNGYSAKDWQQVKTVVLELARDEAFVEAL